MLIFFLALLLLVSSPRKNLVSSNLPRFTEGNVHSPENQKETREADSDSER